jgi:hypothetical protein
MKKLTFILFLSLTTYASSLNLFQKELEESLMLDLSHLDRVTNKIRIKKAKGFQLWMMNKMGAEATYNDVTNLILLRPKK